MRKLGTSQGQQDCPPGAPGGRDGVHFRLSKMKTKPHCSLALWQHYITKTINGFNRFQGVASRAGGEPSLRCMVTSQLRKLRPQQGVDSPKGTENGGQEEMPGKGSEAGREEVMNGQHFGPSLPAGRLRTWPQARWVPALSHCQVSAAVTHEVP